MTAASATAPKELVTYKNLYGHEYWVPKNVYHLLNDVETLAHDTDENFQKLVEMVIKGSGSQQEVDDLVAKLGY